MDKCKYMTDNGICIIFSDDESQQPCVEGPCLYLEDQEREEANHG